MGVRAAAASFKGADILAQGWQLSSHASHVGCPSPGTWLKDLDAKAEGNPSRASFVADCLGEVCGAREVGPPECVCEQRRDDPVYQLGCTIPKMRILCVHGQGASPQIMETQLGSLRPLLPSTWEYDYIEAPHPSAPGPGLKDIYPGPNFSFFDEYSPEAMLEATEYLSEVIDEDGPYDAVIGFSQGASVTASYLASHLQSHPFKFAILICAALIPPSSATADELARTIGSFGQIDIPTCHIIGEKDLCYNQSMQLVKSCESLISNVVFHSGGHDIPRDRGNCEKMAMGIEKVARVAMARC